MSSAPSLNSKQDVLARTRLSHSKLYALLRDNKFPQPIRHGGRNYWPSEEISGWIEKFVAEGRKHRPVDRERFSELGKLSVASRRAKQSAREAA